MKKYSFRKKFLFVFLISSFFPYQFIAVKAHSYSDQNSCNTCTIFTVTSENNDKVYFCNNEDYYPNHMRMYFFPAFEGKYGKVLYGFTYHHGFNPLGGMNDQGLSADENWVPSTPVKRDPDKTDYIQNNVFTRILEECATVADVIEWIKSYNLICLENYPCQVHFADKTGDAAIIGIDPDGETTITRKKGNYSLSTNFNVAHGREPCWRYDTAEKKLEDMKEVSRDYCLSILKATHQEGMTKYSNINDLKNKILYFYTPLTNYEGVAIVDLSEELSKGFHSYDILTLITRKGNAMYNLTFIASTVIVLGCILVGCTLIWVYRIRPEIMKSIDIIKNKRISTRGDHVKK